MKRVLEAFCERTGSDPKAIRLMFDGERIPPDATPSSLQLQEGDALDVLEQQVGGSC